MASYRLTPRAQQDIAEIWKATADRWSAGQAAFYLQQIQGSIDVVLEDFAKARPCDEIRKGYSKFSSGSHVVFSRHGRNGTEVVRILPSQMDFEPNK